MFRACFHGLFLAAALALPAAAQTTLGLLDGNVPTSGVDAPWSYSLNAGAVTISNSTDVGALQYFFAEVPDQKDRAVAVDMYIDPASGADGFGALMFGFDTTERRYGLVALHGDGRVTLYMRDMGGFTPMISTSLETKPTGWVRLDLQERGDEVEWRLNGERLGSMSRQGLGSGAVGIAAGGLVHASFANFSVTGWE